MQPNDRPTRWYELNPARLVLEKKAMETRFPGFRLVRDPDRNELGWIGTLETNSGTPYKVVLYYPNDFPQLPPRVFPVDPVIAIYRDEAKSDLLQHQFRDGALCLFHPQDQFFQPNTTAATVLAAAAAWLFAYESWMKSGRSSWPGKEAD